MVCEICNTYNEKIFYRSIKYTIFYHQYECVCYTLHIRYCVCEKCKKEINNVRVHSNIKVESLLRIKYHFRLSDNYFP